MRFFEKIATAARLSLRADWPLIHNRLLHNIGRTRLRLHRGKLFRHGSLGFPAVCHPDWPDSADQFIEMAADRWEISLMRAWLRDDDLVIDAGTSLGIYAFGLATAIAGPNGRVLAVDADAFAVGKLDAAVKQFHTVNLIPLHAAIADHEGEVTFYKRQDNISTSEQSLRSPAGSSGDAMIAVSVPMTTLPALCRQHADSRIPDMVKMDIEGAEVSALAAVPDAWFEPNGPFWLIEINPLALARFGATPADVLRRFHDQAFELWLLPKHPLRSSASMSLRPVLEGEAFDDSLYYNLIAVPRGLARANRRANLRLPPADASSWRAERRL